MTDITMTMNDSPNSNSASASTSDAQPEALVLPGKKTDWKSPAMQKRIARRYAAEKRFKFFGLLTIILSCAFLAFLLFTMVSNGARGFVTTQIALEIDFPAATGNTTAEALKGDLRNATLQSIDVRGIFNTARQAQYGADSMAIFSSNAWVNLRQQLIDNPSLIEQRGTFWVPASYEIDRASKSGGQLPEVHSEEMADIMGDYRILQENGQVQSAFNWAFLRNADGTDPTQAGIWGALKGSLMTIFITFIFAFPVAVMAAIYLEEYATQNRLTDIIEISINNLAAVPSIIFGLLGLAIFLNFMHLPRSAPLVGGLTLALMTMPVIVIASRNAIKSVPPSIRQAALGMGASPVQVVFHHVLPLAIPGIMTGTIIGMARALGETAPLLMIGMRIFNSTPPATLTSPSTVMPVQIYLWSDEVSAGFIEKTSAAIIVLLAFLLTMNAIAVYLRNRFETKW